MKIYETTHLVKGEDLNHHGTLFAARAASWLVEAAFVAAGCAYGKNELVCRNLHQMSFTRPVQPGTILNLSSRVVLAGKTSFMVSVTAVDTFTGQQAFEGMITFVTVDEKTGKKVEHGIILDESADAAEERLRKEAERIKKTASETGR